jgi:hypothetical protein
VQATTTRPKITVAADGEGVVSHVDSRLLADVADRTTLAAQLAGGLAGLRKPRARLGYPVDGGDGSRAASSSEAC